MNSGCCPSQSIVGGQTKIPACFFEFFDACRFGNDLLTLVVPKKLFPFCVFENIFWRMSVRKCFLASVVLKSFLVSVALKIVFVALAYLVALKMFFCQIFISKCFLAVVSLKILYP